MKKVTVSGLLKKKQAGEKITSLTAYDASFAKMFDEQGIDALLIGDSLGMVLQGEDDTLPVTIDDIAYHTRSVRAGTQRAFVLADRRAFQLLTHPKFRAGYDFLLVRGQIEGGELLELAQWWTQFQHADATEQKGMLNALRKSENGPRPRKRKRRPAKRPPDA